MIHDQQLTLGLPPPPATGDTPLIPVRMNNELIASASLKRPDPSTGSGAQVWFPRLDCLGLIEAW